PHQFVPNPIESPRFRAYRAALRTAQRAGSETHPYAGIHPAPYFTRAARRIRPGADRHRHAARARGQTRAGEFLSARRTERSPGNYAVNAEQYPQLVAGAASRTA